MTFDIWFTIDTVWKLDPNQWFSVTNKTRLFLFVCHFLEGGRCIDFGFILPSPSPPGLLFSDAIAGFILKVYMNSVAAGKQQAIRV